MGVGTRLGHSGGCFLGSVGVISGQVVESGRQRLFDFYFWLSTYTVFAGGPEAKRYEDDVDFVSCGDQSKDTGNSELIHWHVRPSCSSSN